MDDGATEVSQSTSAASSLLDQLNIEKADLLGYSLGAGVAIRLATQCAEKVRSLIPVSRTLKQDGQYPEVIAAFPDMVTNAAEIGGGVAASDLAHTYPDANWTAAFRKMGELESEAWDWIEEARATKAKTLLIFADADSMMGEHIVAMYQAFGGFARDATYDGTLRPAAHLAILPGRTHYDIMETVAVAELVESFLSRADA